MVEGRFITFYPMKAADRRKKADQLVLRLMPTATAVRRRMVARA